MSIIKVLLSLPLYSIVLFLIGSYLAGKLGFLEVDETDLFFKSSKSIDLSDNIQGLRRELLDLTLQCRKAAVQAQKSGTKECFLDYAYNELSQDSIMDEIAKPYRTLFDSALKKALNLISPALWGPFTISHLEGRFASLIQEPLDDCKVAASSHNYIGRIKDAHLALKTAVRASLTVDLQNYINTLKAETKVTEFFPQKQVERASKLEFQRFVADHLPNVDLDDENQKAAFERLVNDDDRNLPKDLQRVLEAYKKKSKGLLRLFADSVVDFFRKEK